MLEKKIDNAIVYYIKPFTHSTEHFPMTSMPSTSVYPSLASPMDVIQNTHTVSFQHIDALQLLQQIPDSQVHLVLIDPPYVISRNTGFQQGSNPDYDRLKVSMDFGTWDMEFTEDALQQIIIESFRILQDGGTFICFFDLFKITPLKNCMETAGFKQIRFLEWIKTNPVPLNQSVNYLTNAREIALLGVKKGKSTFHGKYDNGCYFFPIEHKKGRFHPTQKNLDLIKTLITKHSNPQDVVVDCFSGSATAGVASIQTHRRFIGSELHPQYFAQAKQRLLDTQNQCRTTTLIPK